MKSNQFLFNKAVRGLIKQDCKSVDEDTCAYRSEGGMRCGVGMVLPNSVYTVDMEGQSIEYVHRTYSGRLANVGIGAEHLPLLAAIQQVHDQEEVHAWRDKFKAVAKEYSLTMPRI